MRRLPLMFLVLIGPAAAQEDANVTQMKRLYSKIADVLTVGNNQVRQGGTFLVLTSPGYLLDPKLNPDGNVQDRVRLNALIEKTMEPDWIYRPKTTLTSEVYRKVLTYHQAPEFSLSADLKKSLTDANAEIYIKNTRGTLEYTAGWTQYMDLHAAYASVIDETQTWMKSNPGQLLPAVMNNKLKKAKEDYYTLGDGARRSALYQRKREWEAFDPEFWWSELQGFFDGNIDDVGGRPYPRNLYYPKYSSWINKTAKWTRISFSQKDFQQTTINGSTSSGGGLNVTYGLFSVGGSGSGSSDWKKIDQDVSSLAVAFDVMRVNIERPWMDTMVFYSNAWRWGCGLSVTDKPVLSNGGDPSKGQQLSGVMPLLPTGVLIGRNLDISVKASKYLQDTVNSQSSGGGSVSFGPFRLGGRSSSSSSSDYIHATATSTGVTFGDAQIIGFFVEVLPATPNPLPNLTFRKCDTPAGAIGVLSTTQPPSRENPSGAYLDNDSLKLLDRHLDKFNPKRGTK